MKKIQLNCMKIKQKVSSISCVEVINGVVFKSTSQRCFSGNDEVNKYPQPVENKETTEDSHESRFTVFMVTT